MVRALVALTILCSISNSLIAQDVRPNVLFIAVDDLRPELGCYGQAKIHSPNIDRLAASGVRFNRAYCMVPTCGASRASLMTGIRPSPNRFVSYLAWAEKDAPGVTTMNTHFRDHGYETVSLGKVFHHPQDSSAGWSEPAWRPKNVPRYRRPANEQLQSERNLRGPAWESADVPDDAYADGVLATAAIAKLRALHEGEQPFFLAVGFFKPHLPFVAPSKYWKLYPDSEISLPDNYFVPENAPEESIHSFGELRAYANIPAKGPVSDATARKLIHGYYACVSYTDAQIGKLLDELDRLGIADDTVVVLWGDHGWNLGEHTLWCKHCCYETSMRIPIIVRAPGVTGGVATDGLTESIDIYPSLCELANLPAPDHLQGTSFVPLLRDPGVNWKSAAVGRFRNGDTVRSDNYRYTEYTKPNKEVTAQMIYDHQGDSAENHNIVDQPDVSRTVDRLSKMLDEKKGRDGAATGSN